MSDTNQYMKLPIRMLKKEIKWILKDTRPAHVNALEELENSFGKTHIAWIEGKKELDKLDQEIELMRKAISLKS